MKNYLYKYGYLLLGFYFLMACASNRNPNKEQTTFVDLSNYKAITRAHISSAQNSPVAFHLPNDLYTIPYTPGSLEIGDKILTYAYVQPKDLDYISGWNRVIPSSYNLFMDKSIRSDLGYELKVIDLNWRGKLKNVFHVGAYLERVTEFDRSGRSEMILYYVPKLSDSLLTQYIQELFAADNTNINQGKSLVGHWNESTMALEDSLLTFYQDPKNQAALELSLKQLVVAANIKSKVTAAKVSLDTLLLGDTSLQLNLNCIVEETAVGGIDLESMQSIQAVSMCTPIPYEGTMIRVLKAYKDSLNVENEWSVQAMYDHLSLPKAIKLGNYDPTKSKDHPRRRKTIVSNLLVYTPYATIASMQSSVQKQPLTVYHTLLFELIAE